MVENSKKKKKGNLDNIKSLFNVTDTPQTKYMWTCNNKKCHISQLQVKWYWVTLNLTSNFLSGFPLVLSFAEIQYIHSWQCRDSRNPSELIQNLWAHPPLKEISSSSDDIRCQLTCIKWVESVEVGWNVNKGLLFCRGFPPPTWQRPCWLNVQQGLHIPRNPGLMCTSFESVGDLVTDMYLWQRQKAPPTWQTLADLMYIMCTYPNQSFMYSWQKKL